MCNTTRRTSITPEEASKMAVAWEERLDQLEHNFLVEVERLKHDILGQLQVNDDKYYNIDNEVNLSFTHHPTASPSVSSYTSPASSPSTSLHASQNEVNEGFATQEDDSLHHSAASIDTSSFASAAPSPSPSLISQLTASRPSTSPVPPSSGPGEGDGRGKSRRVAPERQAAAQVVRVRATYNFEAHEEDELSLPKGLELIVFMREVPHPPSNLVRLLHSQIIL
jgi:hypothetical protein